MSSSNVYALDPNRRGYRKERTQAQKKRAQKDKEERDRRIQNEQVINNFNLRKPKPIQQPV